MPIHRENSKPKEVKTAFHISLSNRFEVLQDLPEESDTTNTKWQKIRGAWKDTCQEVLGHSKRENNEWISVDTIQKMDERKRKKAILNTSRTRAAKSNAQEAYTIANNEVKQSIRRDKRDNVDNLAKQAEEAAAKGNLKDLYMTTKKLSNKFQQTEKPVRDKHGNSLTTTEDQLKRWMEHFKDLLNRPPPESPPDIPPADTDLPINCKKPSKAEIMKAIATLKNGKAAGPDDIPAVAIKADPETAVNMLHDLLTKI